jgi:prepilin-type processing-associated H-X9-DG protein
MRELLIRYLLGELDADERRDLQARLRESPELRAELAQLRSCLAQSQDDDLFAPDAPSGLAARTAERVVGGEEPSDSAISRREAALSQAGDPPAGILGWSLADLTVAGGVMLAVSMLLFPAIRSSRDGTRQVGCQNNLRQLGTFVALYAQDHRGDIPEVGPKDPAGVYVLRLVAGRYVTADEMRKLLVCPGAPLADKVRAGTFAIPLPSAIEIRAMSPKQLECAASKASPFYAYALPYRVDGKYCKIRNDHRQLSPVISDAASSDPTNPMSPNHGGRLVQVLWLDGGVRVLPSITLPGMDDDMYHNDRGKVAAGLGPLDTVLGGSDAIPGEDIADGKLR